jgi:aminopeptidase N
MKEASPRTVYLRDYQPPPFLVDTVALYFDLRDDATEVQASLAIRRNPESLATPADLRLDGEKLELLSVRLDERVLREDEYLQDKEGLTIYGVPDTCVLETRCRIFPHNNTELEGLYLSSGNYCTQCEAQGFRKITFYPDRPDVMSVFTVRIEADRKHFPVLLSNGNAVASGELSHGRHWVQWRDPFPKPSYLFALVAGNLACSEDTFTTASGRTVALRIYTEAHNIDKTGHAMRSLQRAMRWDEERFGLEYDLDIYMIVAVDDFNMGAMENKGLNVFNSRYVLATPETATDDDYIAIESIIAHEYFHNWTGNRVTCRDWFQLSLKEGLTVFRDQEFTADMTSAAVTRIDNVRKLRTHQFAEDAGPMSHPVRPPSFIEINNFYTLTVYEKGAEVVRMYQTLLGRESFRRGMDLYFQRHDGQAVTTEDFLAAMADANGRDLSQFQRWYDQPGTPLVDVKDDWNDALGEYRLHMRQSLPDENAQPQLIPMATGLLDNKGHDLLADDDGMLILKDREQTFVFSDLPQKPLPSLLRSFSAPVRLQYRYTDDELAFLMAHDSDDFNRWDAGQRLITKILLQSIEDLQYERELSLNPAMLSAVAKLLNEPSGDMALLAESLTLPDEIFLAEQMTPVDVENIHHAHEFVRMALANTFSEQWRMHYEALRDSYANDLDEGVMGKRRFKNLALDFLLALNSDEVRELALAQFRQATNMTDSISALSALVRADCSQASTALAEFEKRWRHDPLVMDKWFALQAGVIKSDSVPRVRALMQHPQFSLKNPNKVRAVIGAFASRNTLGFHAEDGTGYRFVAEHIIELDALNPQIASRLSRSFSRWRQYDAQRQSLMQAELEKIYAATNLSRDVYEVVERLLGNRS